MVLTVYDAGLQAERTLLAWHRTCLAVAVGSAIGARLLASHAGIPGFALGLMGLALAGAAWFGAHRRYGRAHRSLMAADRLAHGAGALALLSAASLLLACTAGGVVAMLGAQR
ncbi:hypothetical protein GCM10009846_00350 [Agrococcus versicolor]|uniref:DUF202 domain-containing protein n=1 Tax=Agrococcus versicolor TaxID=501482 RepID=A0ABP5M8B7_9MICO